MCEETVQEDQTGTGLLGVWDGHGCLCTNFSDTGSVRTLINILYSNIKLRSMLSKEYNIYYNLLTVYILLFDYIKTSVPPLVSLVSCFPII